MGYWVLFRQMSYQQLMLAYLFSFTSLIGLCSFMDDRVDWFDYWAYQRLI